MKLKDLKNIDKDDVLDLLGLEESSPTSDFFTGLGLFAVGVLVGAGLGVLFAPKRGEEMREQVSEAWRTKGRQAQDFARDLGVEAGTTATNPMGGSTGH